MVARPVRQNAASPRRIHFCGIRLIDDRAERADTRTRRYGVISGRQADARIPAWPVIRAAERVRAAHRKIRHHLMIDAGDELVVSIRVVVARDRIW